MIKIDGSCLEGGGQILRTSLALAAVFRKPCEVFNIRAKRKNPGLAHQHLISLRALAKLSCGSIEGDFLKSGKIIFYPGSSYRHSVSVNIKTASSIPLVLQALLPFSLTVDHPITIHITGGATDTFFSPSWDFFQHVFLRILGKMGANIKVETIRRGYYPEGMAEVSINIFPGNLKPFSITERGELKRVLIFSGASASLKSKKVAERQCSGAKEILAHMKGIPFIVETNYYPTVSPGSHICLIAEFEHTFLAQDMLGKMGLGPEDVGRKTAFSLLNEGETGGALDKHMTDQIIPYLPFSPKKTEILSSVLTSHTQTNIWATEQFVKGKFKTKNSLISWLPQNKAG